MVTTWVKHSQHCGRTLVPTALAWLLLVPFASAQPVPGTPRNSAGVGRGVYRSTDGGKTWKSVGLEKTERIHKLILHPTNPEIAYMGSTWGENPERGVYKTTDGGTSWRKLTPKEGIPEGELGRIGLAFARNNPKVVYALVEAKRNVLMRSDDSGTNWKAVNQEKNVSPRPFYFSDIAVSPTDENTIYRMANAFDVSTDGGKTLKPVTRRGVLHGDHHALWIHPNGTLMADGNDGGMGISLDQGKKWRFIDNPPVAQFYRISADLEVPCNVSGGLQDSGSWRGPSAVLKGGALLNAHWETVGTGDGFFALTDPDNPDYSYSTGLTQQLNVLLNTLQSSFDAPTEAVLVRFAKLEKQSNALLAEVQTVYKTE